MEEIKIILIDYGESFYTKVPSKPSVGDRIYLDSLKDFTRDNFHKKTLDKIDDGDWFLIEDIVLGYTNDYADTWEVQGNLTNEMNEGIGSNTIKIILKSFQNWKNDPKSESFPEENQIENYLKHLGF